MVQLREESRIPWSEAAATAPPALSERATEKVVTARRRLALRRAAWQVLSVCPGTMFAGLSTTSEAVLRRVLS